jgi:magnesium chelatase accessory protein
MTCSRAQEFEATELAGKVLRPAAGLSASIEGSGPDLLLIHGLSAHRGEWDDAARLLRERFRVIRPDLAGRGDSVADPGARFGLQVEVARLVEFADSVGMRRPIVVGHSHGAALAVALSARRSCRALLLVNPITPWTRRPYLLGLLRYETVRRAVAPLLRHYRRPLTRYILTRRVYADPARATEGAVARYADAFATPGRARTLARVLADWRPSDLAEFDRPAGVPVHVLTGGRDRRTPADMAGRWADRLGGPCTVLDDCAHGVPEEAPERVADLILELDRISSA